MLLDGKFHNEDFLHYESRIKNYNDLLKVST